MNTAELITIDVHAHPKLSCWSRLDNSGKEYDGRIAGRLPREENRLVIFTVDLHTRQLGGHEVRKLIESHGVRGFKFQPTVQGVQAGDKSLARRSHLTGHAPAQHQDRFIRLESEVISASIDAVRQHVAERPGGVRL